MCFFFAFLAFAVLLLAFALWLARGRPDAEGSVSYDLRGTKLLINVGGIGLIFGSFFFLPWVKFAPVDYFLGMIPELIEDVAPDAISSTLSFFGHRTLSGLVDLLDSIGSLPGWGVFILVLIATLFISKAYLPLLIAMLLLPVTATWTLGWLSLSQLVRLSEDRQRSLARTQATLAALTAVLLLLVLPGLDTLAPSHSPAIRLAGVLLGARMSAMVWLAWVGLVFLFIGGLLAYFSPQEAPCPPSPAL